MPPNGFRNAKVWNFESPRCQKNNPVDINSQAVYFICVYVIMKKDFAKFNFDYITFRPIRLYASYACLNSYIPQPISQILNSNIVCG